MTRVCRSDAVSAGPSRREPAKRIAHYPRCSRARACGVVFLRSGFMKSKKARIEPKVPLCLCAAPSHSHGGHVAHAVISGERPKQDELWNSRAQAVCDAALEAELEATATTSMSSKFRNHLHVCCSALAGAVDLNPRPATSWLAALPLS